MGAFRIRPRSRVLDVRITDVPPYGKCMWTSCFNNFVLNSWHGTVIIDYTYRPSNPRRLHIFKRMYFTKGIEAVATITELRSKTSDLVEHAKNIEHGILIQKNNEPYAVLISYDVYEKLLKASAQSAGRKK